MYNQDLSSMDKAGSYHPIDCKSFININVLRLIASAKRSGLVLQFLFLSLVSPSVLGLTGLFPPGSHIEITSLLEPKRLIESLSVWIMRGKEQRPWTTHGIGCGNQA